jgi:hypothetical protein
VREQPTAPTTNAPAITGTRPNRSIRRPAGSAAVRQSGRSPAEAEDRLDPVTSTSDRRDRDGEWRTPESVRSEGGGSCYDGSAPRSPQPAIKQSGSERQGSRDARYDGRRNGELGTAGLRGRLNAPPTRGT